MLLTVRKSRCLLFLVNQHRFASGSAKRGVRVRFAPSPTGHLHLGGLRTALFNYLFAKQRGGQFVLRIEDTDVERTVGGAAEAIESCLLWLGLKPDESPSRGGPHSPYVQSERLNIYKQYAKELLEQEKAYRCFCSKERLMLKRREAMRMGRDPGYDNACRHLSKEEIASRLHSCQPFVLRLKQKAKLITLDDLVYGSHSFPVRDEVGDPVLVKSDGYPTYHFASVIDDHAMQISHVLRGEEWLASTGIHLQLYEAFQWEPPVFAHLPLMFGLGGAKLSKRDGMSFIEHYRDRCFYPEAVISFACFAGGGFGLAGDSERLTLRSLDDYVGLFDLKYVAKRHPKLDIQWLKLLNRQALARKTDAEILAHTRHLIRHYVPPEEQSSFSDSFILNIFNHYKNEISTLAELFDDSHIFLWKIPLPLQAGSDKSELVEARHIDAVIDALKSLEDDRFQRIVLNDLLCGVAASNGIPRADFMQFLRSALTGSGRGLPIAEVLEILGKNSSLRRLRVVRDHVAPK